MINLTRTDSSNPDFISLVKMLDEYLAIRDGSDHSFYAQYNKLDSIKHVVIAYEDSVPVSCGSVKEFSTDTMEVKRMFTLPEHRGKGIAGQVLSELERWTGELGYTKCILETGRRQTEAIALYKKSGYTVIPNYGQYAEKDYSVCFEKYIVRK